MTLDARLAKNETLFRSINEQIRSLAERLHMADAEFICECADETCTDRVPLTLRQYEEVRAIARRFVVRIGHEATPLVERVLFRSDRFAVVAKIGHAGWIAEEEDPRSGS